MHRVCKALLLGAGVISAVRFDQTPEPDFVGVDPDALPYEREWPMEPRCPSGQPLSMCMPFAATANPSLNTGDPRGAGQVYVGLHNGVCP